MFVAKCVVCQCNVPFSGVPNDMVKMDFQSWGTQVTGTSSLHQQAQGLLEVFHVVLGSFYEVQWHSLGIFHHSHSLPFV